MTLLVALQNSYITSNVQLLFLLKLSLALLALTILAGIISLYGEAQTPLDAINNLRENRVKHGDEKVTKMLNNNILTSPKRIYLFAQQALLVLFGLAFLLLCTFALVNL